MKILFVMPTHISYGGIESVGINLWKGLTELGHEVDFVCHGSIVGAYEDYIKFCGTNVYHIPGKNENIIATICEFKRIITAKSYDVIHAHMNATSGIYLQIASTYHIPILVAHSHVSTMAMYTKNIIKALINLYEKNRTNRFSNVKIACSKKAGDWLFGTEPYSIVLNAIDNNKFVFSDEIRKAKREELQLCENNDVYIHIGGFLAYKNHRYLLRVFRNIKNMNNNARLILIGDGPLRKKIEEELRDLGIADSVFMLGERKDVCELLQAADVFLLPSISEGNPVSLVEAATSGLHCLVSDSVAKDTAPYFLKGSIEFLSISEENIGEWVKKGLKKYNRIIYCEDNPCKLSALSMAKEVEKLYLKISKRDIEGKR